MKTAKDLLDKKGYHIEWVTPDTTIHDAVKIMVEKKMGAILIKESGKFVGIWTERNLLKQILDPDFDARTSPIGDHMITDLKSAPHTATVIQLFDQMVGLRIRHLLIKEEGEYIGFISKRDVTRLALIEKSEENEALNDLVSLEYYEDWHWQQSSKK